MESDALKARQWPLHFIVAVARNGTIGRDNQLPWRLRSDLIRFKKLTMGHSLIMGRKTYDSIGRLLPGRTTIVLTRQAGYSIPGAAVVHSIEDAIAVRPSGTIPFVIGGAELYQSTFPLAGELHITRVDADVDGDAKLDAWDLSDWRIQSTEYVAADENNEWPSNYEHWKRIR